MSAYDAFSRKYWCRKCRLVESGNRKKMKTLKKAEVIVNKNGGKIISVYDDKKRMVVECSDGHKWDVRIKHIAYEDSWCPECFNFSRIGELLCRKYFEFYLDEKFLRSKPSWLNGWELDGYSDKLKIAFEYNGLHHYKEILYYHKKISLATIQYRDNEKVRLCNENGVKLIVIKEDDNLKELSRKIYEVLRTEFKIEKEFIEINVSRKKIEELKNIAFERGGKLISDVYLGYHVPLLWECKNNHQWKSSVGSVKDNKSWCPKCVKNRRLDKNILNLMLPSGWECLKCVGSKGKSKWKCENNHIIVKSWTILKGKFYCKLCKNTVIKKLNYKGIESIGEYVNCNTLQKFKCLNNHYFIDKSINIILRKFPCKICR